MNKTLKYSLITLAFALLVSVCASAFFYYTAFMQSAALKKKRADASVHASAPDSVYAAPVSLQNGGTLFPGLNTDAVTAISVSTPERRFEILLGEDGSVSVNGRRGDMDTFHTLLEQIGEFPVYAQGAFPGDGTPQLTLNVLCSGKHYTARFYSGGQEGAPSYIICDAQGSRHHRRADAWRMGTLLMTCEGIRIQDESGNEFPAD